MTTTTPATTIKRHPIRGFLYGIVFGLGLALIVVGQKWAALGTLPPFLVFLAGIVLGTLWATFGPAKAPKGTPPPADPVTDEADEPPAEEPPTEDPAADQLVSDATAEDSSGEDSSGEEE